MLPPASPRAMGWWVGDPILSTGSCPGLGAPAWEGLVVGHSVQAGDRDQESQP